MSERLSRLTALLGRLESTYGSGAGTFTATDAVLCVDAPTITFESDNVDRNLVLPFMGNSQQLPARQRARIKFSTELVGSGTKGTPPAWGKWLRACGFSETIVAATSVTYNLVNSGFESLSIRFNKAGVRYLGLGGRGNCDLVVDAYGIPRLNFEFLAFGVTPIAEAVPAVDLTAFLDPQIINTENSGHLWLGGTMGGGGAFSGGAMVPFKSISFGLGNTLVHRKVVDDERILIRDRSVTGKIVVDHDVTDEIAAWTAIKLASTTTIGFRHGTADGRYVSIYAPKAQRLNPSHVDDEGALLQGYDVRCVPGMTGTPELAIMCA